ncbi:hypothetical protein RO3G_01527 [Rhizopus delemar RA 99-880]|uniref:Uncharacterized protein n=1 Tax=Rhizopus delemar (strain RA 99-880 / ATCC MYA-4621 / FGSC 9543 / NRRL 43880) TaxID=246409 RepID=I1BKU3_RHIO9|nr:hypothetical protein RO3G_01527 [Rhizopus delemar RA 99-880]|eukprot:EIE76823.1 hypothetical protein RO3G_01527 [Rhizopus delemar RA 99-880]
MAKFNTDYFYLTPAKKWKLIDAIDYFDKLNSYNSFYEILLDLSAALNKIKATQASFKKYVKSMEEELMKLLKLNIYAREPPLDNQENITPIAQGISNTTQNLPAETQENSNIEKLSDVLNNHGQINVRPNHATFISSKALGKRQADQINDGDPTLTNPLPRNATPSEFEIDEGPNHYQMSSPSVHVEHPHKPKLRRLQISNLIELFHFGTSFSRSNPITNAEYLTYEEDQQINKSLKSLNILHHLVYLLEEIPYDQFNATLWIKNVDNLDRRSCTFLDIVRYTLCSFHLVAKTVPEYMNNHERTYFIENIIPSMLSLAKNTGFIEFKWYGRKKCETEFHSTKTLNLVDYDYDLRGAPPSKNIDALGILSTQNNMELIVVESSRFVEGIGMWSGSIEKRSYSLQECIIGYIQEAESLLRANNKDAGNTVGTVFI